MGWLAKFLGLFGLGLARVSGDSMLPTLSAGALLLFRRYGFTKPARGDLALATIGDHQRRVVKRVFALPGETVFDERGELRRGTPRGAARRVWRLGDRDYFLMSDNPLNTTDSRHFGLVERSALVGRVVWTLFGG